MPIEKLKPIHVFVPFTRVSTDDEERIVEGYAFTQEVVQGEGGKRLKRSAMEAATADYLENGTVRSMHGPIAAGTPLEVKWDAKGALIRAYIADDQEWRKVKSKTYKGFSVGVNALEMRGLDVEKAKWFDSSLVDIGKDTGAKFTVWRADGEEEQDCDVLPAEEIPAFVRYEVATDSYVRMLTAEPPNFDGMLMTDAIDLLRTLGSSDVPTRENLEGKTKGETHYPCNSEYGCHGHTTRGGAQECQEKDAKDKDAQLNWHKEQMSKLKAKRGEIEEADIERTDPPPDPPLPTTETEEQISRIAALETEAALLLTRAETAESELAIERTALVVAKERITDLEKLPMPGQTPPVRFPQAMERTFAANLQDPVQRSQEDARTELKRLEAEAKAEPDEFKRGRIAEQMLRISSEFGITL